MTSPPVEPADLLDLKLLPAWVKEPVDARIIMSITRQKRTVSELRSRASRGHMQRPRIPLNANANRRAANAQERSPTSAGRKAKPSGDRHRTAIRPTRKIAAPRSEMLRLRIQLPEIDDSLSTAPAYSKMSLPRSSPAQSHIRCLPWRVCFWKSLNAMKFGSQERRNRRFITLATMAPCL